MCGRFVSASPPDEIAKYFGVEQVSESKLEPSYNVAPTNDIYTVLESGGVRRLAPMHWGLVPIWAKDPKIGNKMINARSETLAEKNAYKHAYSKKRCIIPADGFYEWERIEGQKNKQPWFIHRTDEQPLAFAGLWEVWRGPGRDSDEELHSCTIITGSPNEKMAEIHDRMPVILSQDQWSTWLDEDQHDLDLLGKLLVPAPASIITMHKVSTEVNNVRNEGPQLTDELDEDDGSDAPSPNAPSLEDEAESGDDDT
jgi:putative SOS response-associated peptidase YedK